MDCTHDNHPPIVDAQQARPTAPRSFLARLAAELSGRAQVERDLRAMLVHFARWQASSGVGGTWDEIVDHYLYGPNRGAGDVTR